VPLDLRLAVGSAIGPKSSVWRLFSRKSDVYVWVGQNRNSKLSFHASGICRNAFTQEYGLPVGMSDRVMHKWRMAQLPPAGSGRATLLLRIWIATDFLALRPPPQKPVTWIPAAEKGSGRAVELMLSPETKAEFLNQIGEDRTLIAYAHLPNGAAAVVTTHIAAGPTGEAAAVPASHHESRTLICAPTTPETAERSAFLFMGNDPKDGDCKEIWEMSGYYIDGPAPPGMAILTRNRVYAKNDTQTIKLK